MLPAVCLSNNERLAYSPRAVFKNAYSPAIATSFIADI